MIRYFNYDEKILKMKLEAAEILLETIKDGLKEIEVRFA